MGSNVHSTASWRSDLISDTCIRNTVIFKDTLCRKGTLLQIHFRNLDYVSNAEHKAIKCKVPILPLSSFKIFHGQKKSCIRFSVESLSPQGEHVF